jgi:hypothetical protein
VRVRCSNGHSLSVKDDLAGQRVRCPKCKVLFRAKPEGDEEDEEKKDAPPPPSRKRKKKDRDGEGKRKVEKDDDEFGGEDTPEERRKERQADKRKRVAQVSTGLLIHTVKLWVFALTVLFLFVWRVLVVSIDNSSLPGVDSDFDKSSVESLSYFSGISLNFILGFVVILPIIGVAGTIFCCLVPKKSEARGTMITGLIFDIIPLFASILIPMALAEFFQLDKQQNERLLVMLATGCIFFNVAALFVFVIFNRLLSYYIQKPLLAAEALNLVSWLMIMVVAAPVVLLGTKFLAQTLVGALGSLLYMIVMFLIAIAWFAMFYLMFFQAMLRLLSAERAAIAEIS